MITPKGNNNWLSNIIFFNKALYIVLAANLLFYTVQLNYTVNFVTNCLLLAIWSLLFTNILMNESFSQLNKKYGNKKIGLIKFLARVNIIAAFILILVFTFFTGNTEFLYLSSIPIIYCLLSSYKAQTLAFLSISVGLITWADYGGWLKKDFLLINQNINVPPVLSYMTVMGLIILLGFIFSNYVKTSYHRTKKLYNLAIRDPLTGLINKRELTRRLNEEMARAKRHKIPLTVALFDLDYFKKINDRFGHVAGDFVLKELGKLIMDNTRTCDIAARYGGEEFALVLPETTEQEACELLERIRTKVQSKIFNYSCIPIKATLSVGVAQFDMVDANFEVLCNKADKALYKAKNNGRNRVERNSSSLYQSNYDNLSINSKIVNI